MHISFQNGKFYYVEHVAAPPRTWMRWFEDKISPLWKEISDGCVLNKETGYLIKRSGFSAVDYKTSEKGLSCGIVKIDIICGTATK